MLSHTAKITFSVGSEFETLWITIFLIGRSILLRTTKMGIGLAPLIGAARNTVASFIKLITFVKSLFHFFEMLIVYFILFFSFLDEWKSLMSADKRSIQ